MGRLLGGVRRTGVRRKEEKARVHGRDLRGYCCRAGIATWELHVDKDLLGQAQWKVKP